MLLSLPPELVIQIATDVVHSSRHKPSSLALTSRQLYSASVSAIYEYPRASSRKSFIQLVKLLSQRPDLASAVKRFTVRYVQKDDHFNFVLPRLPNCKLLTVYASQKSSVTWNRSLTLEIAFEWAQACASLETLVLYQIHRCGFDYAANRMEAVRTINLPTKLSSLKLHETRIFDGDENEGKVLWSALVPWVRNLEIEWMILATLDLYDGLKCLAPSLTRLSIKWLDCFNPGHYPYWEVEVHRRMFSCRFPKLVELTCYADEEGDGGGVKILENLIHYMGQDHFPALQVLRVCDSSSYTETGLKRNAAISAEALVKQVGLEECCRKRQISLQTAMPVMTAEQD